MTLRMWRVLALLMMLGWLLPGMARAQAVNPPGPVSAIIAQANALGAQRNFTGAIQLLTDATHRYPTDSALYLALARWQEARGLSIVPVDDPNNVRDTLRQRLNLPPFTNVAREVFDTYGRATMFMRDIREIQRQIGDLVTFEYPVLLGEHGPMALPGSPITFRTTVSDPQLPTELRGEYLGLVTTRPLSVPERYRRDPKYGRDPAYANDPRYGNWTFPNMLLAYAYERESRAWHLRFRVFWQEVPGKEEQRALFARQSAMLLLQCSTLVRAYTGLPHRFAQDGAINVWLAEKGDAGGEAFDDSIYIYAIDIQRTPAEWVREFAHEYGHQTLPVVGGYTRPEWGANGLLGERLFMRWLALNRETHQEAHPWVRALETREVMAVRVDPLVQHFAGLGPNAPVMRDTDHAAMEGFAGMALYLEMARGSRYLSEVLQGMTTPLYAAPQGFLETLAAREAYQQSITRPVVTLRLRDLPPNLPLWVYLREGNWRGELERRDARQPLKYTVEVNGVAVRTDATGAFVALGLPTGWHRIQLAVEGPSTDLPTALTLIRQ